MLVYLLRAGDAATGVWRVATRGGGADARGEIRAGLVSPTRVLSSRWHPSRTDPEPYCARHGEPQSEARDFGIPSELPSHADKLPTRRRGKHTLLAEAT